MSAWKQNMTWTLTLATVVACGWVSKSKGQTPTGQAIPLLKGSPNSSAGSAKPQTVSAAHAPAPPRRLSTGTTRTDRAVVPASHVDVDSGARSSTPTSEPNVWGLPQWPSGRSSPVPTMTTSLDRTKPPAITGSHLGLRPGETATERALRLMATVAELERANEELSQRDATMAALVQQRDDKLAQATREIKSARRELSLAREQLERLQAQTQELQKKIRAAERENTAMLQSIAPLLHQLLETDASETPPPKPE